MEDMIKKIVEADNEAKALEENALKEREEVRRQIKKETDAIYERYMKQAAEQIKRNDAREEKKGEKALEEIFNRQKSARIKLGSDFKQNCEQWVDAIYKRTLGKC